MTQANPSRTRLSAPLLTGAIALMAALPWTTAGAQQAASAGFASVQGIVTDSLHGVPLAGAIVHVDGTSRSSVTDGGGHYRIDSIPAGSRRVLIGHALIDTIGIQMSTAPVPFAAGELRDLDLAIPSSERLVSLFCPAATRRVLGPAALIGFVRDPDTGEAATGSKVQLVYTELDAYGIKKTQKVREGAVDSTGNYRICGLPPNMTGKVQVFRNGVSSGEVPAELQTDLLGLRSFSIVAQHQVIATVKSDSGASKQVARGSARVSGRVLNKLGQPLSGARVTLQGSDATVITRPNGDFTLDSLPSGTQSLEVRKLGYGATEKAVELSSVAAASVTVTMEDYAPTLETMRVEATRDKALMDIGFLQRKQGSATGYFLEGDQINKASTVVSDVLRMVPSLKVVPVGDGRTYTVTPARDPSGGCVTYVVDRMPWRQMTPGDIDQFVRPDELQAIEVYSGAGTPPEFSVAGQSGCTTIVMWTVRGVQRAKGKGK